MVIYMGVIKMNKLLAKIDDNNIWLRWLQIAVASVLYILANALDYYFTFYGMIYTNHREANPIARGYMNLFGMQHGLLIYKALMIVMIISAVIAADIICRRRKIRFRPAYILYFAAIATTFAGSLWFINI